MLLLSASDGERGAKLVLDTAFNRIKRENSDTLFKFSLKNFHSTFDLEKGILDAELNKIVIIKPADIPINNSIKITEIMSIPAS